ncbi:MAG: hypothetical protein ABL971_00555 [Vicinamibacterales bacterium]
MSGSTQPVLRRLEIRERLAEHAARGEALRRALPERITNVRSWAALARAATEFHRELAQRWLLQGLDAQNGASAQVGLDLGAAWAERAAKRNTGAAENDARDAARAVATAVHAHLTLAFAQGRERRGLTPNMSLDERLAAAESAYVVRLRGLRRAARRGDAAGARAVAAILGEVVAETRGTSDSLAVLAFDAAAISTNLQLERNAPGLRASAHVRKNAFLAAAAICLHARLLDPATRSTTPEIAERRTRLSRRDLSPRNAWTHVSDALVGRTGVSVLGAIRDLQWIERGARPFGAAVFAPSGSVVRLPFKSFTRNGISPGATVLAVGRVKPADDHTPEPWLEIEQEGPSEYANTVWEDWLAVLVRDAYDLYPGSLRAEWELPAFGARGGRNDLLARIETPNPRSAR